METSGPVQSSLKLAVWMMSELSMEILSSSPLQSLLKLAIQIMPELSMEIPYQLQLYLIVHSFKLARPNNVRACNRATPVRSLLKLAIQNV
jgi:hypothetical protein